MIKMEFTSADKKNLFEDVGKIEFKKGSVNKGYKYKAFIPVEIWNKWRPDDPAKRDRTVRFGKAGYMHYHDILGEWEEYDHNNEERRELYKKRHEPIMIKIDDEMYHSYLVPFTNEFFSYWLMW